MKAQETSEYGARKRLDGFLAETEGHIGRICIRRVAYRNPGFTFKPEQAVAVELVYSEGL